MASIPSPSAAALVAGTRVALDGEVPEPAVDPAASFEVRAPIPLRETRLVLLDSRGALVASAAEAEFGVTSRFTLVPAEPLVPAGRYTLRLEGLRGRHPADAGGKRYEPLAFPFQVSGDPPPPPSRKSKRRAAR